MYYSANRRKERCHKCTILRTGVKKGVTNVCIVFGKSVRLSAPQSRTAVEIFVKFANEDYYCISLKRSNFA